MNRLKPADVSPGPALLAIRGFVSAWPCACKAFLLQKREVSVYVLSPLFNWAAKQAWKCHFVAPLLCAVTNAFFTGHEPVTQSFTGLQLGSGVSRVLRLCESMPYTVATVLSQLQLTTGKKRNAITPVQWPRVDQVLNN